MALKDIPEYNHAIRIWQVISPVLILMGTVGNVVTILVLSRKRSRRSSTSIYLCALATADLLVLYTGLLRQWIKYAFDVDIRHLSNTGCKIHVFLVYVGTQASSWFLVAVTFERFIGVWKPIRSKRACTHKSAMVIVAVTAVCLAVLNIHWFYGYGGIVTTSGNTSEITTCVSQFDHYDKFLYYVWPWIDLCVFCLVPFTILMIGNVFIIVKVLLSKHKTQRQVVPAKSTTKQKRDNKSSQLTIMLLTLNIFFVVCVSPISIYLIGEPYWTEYAKTDYDRALLILWWAVTNILMYLNHTMNFVLYFLSGSRFRAEVVALFKGGRGKAVFGGDEMTSRVEPTTLRPAATQNTCINDPDDNT